MEEAELNKKRVSELRSMLKDLGLLGYGTKSELIKRLVDHYNSPDAKALPSDAPDKEEKEDSTKETRTKYYLQ